MLRGLAVLVVDDNATNRRILQEMLLLWQMNPHLDQGWTPRRSPFCNRPPSRGTPFPLVLLDAQMPEHGRIQRGRTSKPECAHWLGQPSSC